MQKAHARFIQGSPSLVVIAGGAGCDHVVPNMLTAKMARQDVVDGVIGSPFAAVLASKIISAEYFAAGQL